MLFQSQLNGYVKAWIDGDENYGYYTIDEIMKLVKGTGDHKLVTAVSNMLATASFYLWDVLEGTIRRTSTAQDTSDLMSKLKDQAFANRSTDFSGISFDLGTGQIIKN